MVFPSARLLKMSYIGGVGHSSDVEQDKLVSDFRSLNRSNTNLATKSKFSDVLWNHKDDSDSEISDSGNFLAKGKKNIFFGTTISSILSATSLDLSIFI